MNSDLKDIRHLELTGTLVIIIGLPACPVGRLHSTRCPLLQFAMTGMQLSTIMETKERVTSLRRRLERSEADCGNPLTMERWLDINVNELRPKRHTSFGTEGTLVIIIGLPACLERLHSTHCPLLQFAMTLI